MSSRQNVSPGPDGARAFFRAVRAIDGLGLRGLESDLSALDIPALLVWGEGDPFVPPEVADRLAEALARPALVLLPGCAHFTPHEAPETVGPLVAQFVASNWLGRPVQHQHAHGPMLLTVERRGPA